MSNTLFLWLSFIVSPGSNLTYAESQLKNPSTPLQRSSSRSLEESTGWTTSRSFGGFWSIFLNLIVDQKLNRSLRGKLLIHKKWPSLTSSTATFKPPQSSRLISSHQPKSLLPQFLYRLRLLCLFCNTLYCPVCLAWLLLELWTSDLCESL